MYVHKKNKKKFLKVKLIIRLCHSPFISLFNRFLTQWHNSFICFIEVNFDRYYFLISYRPLRYPPGKWRSLLVSWIHACYWITLMISCNYIHQSTHKLFKNLIPLYLKKVKLNNLWCINRNVFLIFEMLHNFKFVYLAW